MRVSINTEEKSTGLIFKKPKFTVKMSVVFSEEENAVILQRKLKDYIVMKREFEYDSPVKDDPTYQDDEFKPHLRIKNLMKGEDKYSFPDPVRAKEYEGQLVESLKTLKSFFEGAKSVGEAKTFEL